VQSQSSLDLGPAEIDIAGDLEACHIGAGFVLTLRIFPSGDLHVAAYQLSLDAGVFEVEVPGDAGVLKLQVAVHVSQGKHCRSLHMGLLEIHAPGNLATGEIDGPVDMDARAQ